MCNSIISSEWVPIMPMCLAVSVLFFNIFTPGVGTMLASCLWLCTSSYGGALESGQRCSLTSIGIIFGIVQLLTAPLIIGWVWSLLTGVAAIRQAGRPQIIEPATDTAELQSKSGLDSGVSSRNTHSTTSFHSMDTTRTESGLSARSVVPRMPSPYEVPDAAKPSASLTVPSTSHQF